MVSISISNVEDLARRLASSLPDALGSFKAEAEAHFGAVVRQHFSELGVVTQEEFRVQAKLLERARAQLELLEARLASLEGAVPPK